MKIFRSEGMPLVPREWLDAMGSPRHRQQAHVVAVAENRAGLARLAASAGFERLAGELKFCRAGNQSTPDQALIDAGVIDLETPAIYAYEKAVRGCAVIRVTPEGRAVVARFALSGLGGGFDRKIVVERVP